MTHESDWVSQITSIKLLGLVEEMFDEEKKECPAGEYYCFDDEMCKPIPKGHKVRKDGELVKEMITQESQEQIDALFEGF